MSDNGAAGGGGTGKGALIWLVGLAAAILGGLLWYAQRPVPDEAVAIVSPAPEAGQTAAPAAPVAEPVAESLPGPADVPAADAPAEAAVATGDGGAEPAAEAAPAAPVAAAPVFSTVRITPQGNALVAGQAAPGTAVTVLVDGAQAATAQANDRGDFVAMFDLPPSAAPRILSLSQQAADGALVSAETVVLEPTAPVATAAAELATAPEAPTAILLSDGGARVLQSANALPDGTVSIAAITYTPDGGVQLSGLGAPTTTVRLYLNNALRGEARVTDSGAWVTTLRGVLPGLYTLRADQVAGDGAVSSRFETPFQRESLEALAAVMKPQAVAVQPMAPAAASDAGTPAPPPAEALAVPVAAPAAIAADAVNVTVQPGFTLWQIARERFGDGVMYVKVYDANRDQIRDPDLIYPGQVFTLPGE